MLLRPDIPRGSYRSMVLEVWRRFSIDAYITYRVQVRKEGIRYADGALDAERCRKSLRFTLWTRITLQSDSWRPRVFEERVARNRDALRWSLHQHARYQRNCRRQWRRRGFPYSTYHNCCWSVEPAFCFQITHLFSFRHNLWIFYNNCEWQCDIQLFICCSSSETIA